MLSLIISSDYWIGRGANDWVQKGMHCELGARGGDGGGGTAWCLPSSAG